MTIKSVIKKEETIEKEISLPYFCKYFDKFSDKFTYFKLTEDKVIDAMIGNYTSVSCYSHGVNDRKIAESEQITEQEFNEAYHKALFEIGKYVPATDVPKPLLMSNDFNAMVFSLAKDRSMLHAVKWIKEQTGWGLKESKQYADNLLRTPENIEQ